MAFQISINDHYDISISSNDRADWSLTDVPGGFVAEGFGGENIVTLQYTTMQSGNASIHVTSLCCDSPVTFAHRDLDADRTYSLTRIADAINELLRDLLTYPATEKALQDLIASRRK